MAVHAGQAPRHAGQPRSRALPPACAHRGRLSGRRRSRRAGTRAIEAGAARLDRRGRIAEGDDEMLVCVSRAKGGRVVIDA
ncbi:hypothetical protein BST45_14565 [Mycobacterium shinjukuense]|nr:hypothetical protein BST45_14565 [Mycobacterium shinjukuense]